MSCWKAPDLYIVWSECDEKTGLTRHSAGPFYSIGSPFIGTYANGEEYARYTVYDGKEDRFVYVPYFYHRITTRPF